MRQRLLLHKTGFTLAEVLITLGIIGIVAAMTLPILNAKYQKKIIATQLKTSYTLIQQIFERAKADHEDASYWMESFDMGTSAFDENIKMFVDTYFLPYVHGKFVKGTALEIGYSDYVGTLSNPDKKIQTYDTQYIKLSNGPVINMTFNNNGVQFSDILMYVDVNGLKRPNIRGKDIFLFNFSFKTGKVTLYGYNRKRTTLINNDCGKSEWGDQCCGAIIMLDNWEIKDDYPWI